MKISSSSPLSLPKNDFADTQEPTLFAHYNNNSEPVTEEALSLMEALDERVYSQEYIDLTSRSQKAWDDYYAQPQGDTKKKLLDLARKASSDLSVYKDVTAQIAVELSRERPLTPWHGDVGKLAAQGEPADKSMSQWLADRKRGFGGSDLGNLIDPRTGEISRSANRVIKEKATLELDPRDVAFNMVAVGEKPEGPMARGHAWETVISNMFQDSEHGENIKVKEAKSSFHNPESEWQHVNVDGLLCSDGKIPDGILEIKTSQRPNTFRNDKGEKQLPVNYHLQLLNYMDACGFSRGKLVVLFNDTDLEVHDVNISDKVAGKTFSEHKKTLDALWNKVIEQRVENYGPEWEKKFTTMASDADKVIADAGGAEAYLEKNKK